MLRSQWSPRRPSPPGRIARPLPKKFAALVFFCLRENKIEEIPDSFLFLFFVFTVQSATNTFYSYYCLIEHRPDPGTTRAPTLLIAISGDLFLYRVRPPAAADYHNCGGYCTGLCMA